MGVYINMEIPVTCCHCPLMGCDPDIEWNDGGRDTQGAYICVITHELIDNTKRPDNCPLVPVPPHGRLIDADANLAVLQNVLDNPYTDNGKIDTAMLRACISVFKEAPTIIPAEEGET